MKSKIKFLGSFFLVIIVGFTLITCDPEGDDPACTHDWDWTLNTVAANCTQVSKNTATCKKSGCNETNVRNGSVAALGHEGIGALAVTCTTDGNTGTGTCTRTGCGFIGTNTVIPALGHDSSGAAATCTTAKICARISCDHVLQVALGHDWKWVITTPPNFGTSTAGEQTKTCNRCTETDGTQPYPILALGATGPAGGKIIHVDPAGFTVTSTTSAFTTYTAYYLEAAPTNAGSSIRWSTQSSSPYPDVTGTLLTIGSGRNNTALIIAAEQIAHPVDTYVYAALACKNYVSTGFESFNDWFLPSRDELNQLYLRRADFSITTGWFWSSSQNSNDYAWGQYFGDGHQDVLIKVSGNFVRAVRAF